MSIKTDYNFKGIEVKDAIIKVTRIFGSSKEGWNSLVGVYTQTIEVIPAKDSIDQVGFPGEPNYQPMVEAVPAYEVLKDSLIEEFNFQVPFKEDERGYVTLYLALTEKYGGVEV